MQIENSRERFGAVAQALHWTIAALFLGAFATIYARQWLTSENTPVNWLALQAHLSIGVSALAFAAVRIWWRLRSRIQPDPVPGPWYEHWGARLTHLGLYGLMLVMPLSGYLGTGVDTDFFGLLTIPRFQDTTLFRVVVEGWAGLDFQTFERSADWLHKTAGEILVLALAGLHIAAAIFHHVVRRDDTLRRMLPIRQ